MVLNQKQRWVILAAGCIILFMIVFPPWWWRGTSDIWGLGVYGKSPPDCGGATSYEYRWFFSPPEHYVGKDCGIVSGIEYHRLIAGLGLVLIVGVGLLWVLKDRS